MSDSREYLAVYNARETHQPSRENSTESEEPPPAAKGPPPPVRNGVAGAESSSGCPQENNHQGKELLSTVVQLPIEVVMNLLFMQDNFMNDVYGMKKTYDIVFGTWEDQEDGQKCRQVSYTMTLPSANLGPKVSYVTEKQTILANSRPGVAYSVDVEATNAGIPYSDAFTVVTHYCLNKEDETKTNMRVWGSVKYKKALWGLVKTMIEKNTYSGLEGVLIEVVTQLGIEGDRLAAPKTSRRRKRIADKNHPSSKHSSIASHARKASDSDKGTRNVSVLVVLVALVVLVIGNVVLYIRLSRLEEGSSITDSSFPATRYLSVTGSWKVVAKLLQRQEDIHQHQLDEWKSRLQQASATLIEVQKSLEMIVDAIPEHEEELKRVLKEQSEDVLAVWLQAEETLKHQMNHLQIEETVLERLQRSNSTQSQEMKDHPPAEAEHT